MDAQRIYRRNQEEFEWYCSRFFDFRKALGRVEMGYLDYCFGLVEDSFVERQDISCKTFVHRITGENVDSSGLGYGFKMETDARRLFFHQTLWKIVPSLSFGGLIEGCDAAGIGWNIQNKTIRVYFYYQSLPENLVAFSLAEPVSAWCSKERLIGLTLRDGMILEEKWYSYPIKDRWPELIERFAGESADVQNGLSKCSDRLALMRSDASCPKFQFDIRQDAQDAVIRLLSNPSLTEIYHVSEAAGQTLDTVSFFNGGISAYFE